MNILRTLVFLFLLSFGTTIFVLNLGSGREGELEAVRVEVSAGESLRDIAVRLRRLGLIRSSLAFRLYLQSRGLDRDLQAGAFLLRPGMSFAEIAEMLVSPPESEVRVTIPEGYTLEQIDALLAHMNLSQPGDLLACARERCDFSSFEFLPAASPAFPHGRLEGYVFPDTYYVEISEFVPKFFLERMLGTFRKRVLEGLAADLEVSTQSLHEVVTMASLIERETRAAAERPIVSGILWKRAESGRGLDVDATIRYVLGKAMGPLTREDLQVDSPYNTRRYSGFPPGPIANPGLESLRAALHPEDSSYWYYLHDSTGRIHYSETNDEHNLNKVQYLR
jgi:UPF0755 protein